MSFFKRLEKLSRKLENSKKQLSRFKKELEILQWKTRITKIKNLMDELNSKLNTSDESYWRKRSKETMLKEVETDKNEIKNKIVKTESNPV